MTTGVDVGLTKVTLQYRQEPTPAFSHPSEEGILCFSHPLLGGVPHSGGVGSRSEAKNDRTLFMLQEQIPAYVILDCPAGRYNHRGIRFFHNEWPAPRLFKSGSLIYRSLDIRPPVDRNTPCGRPETSGALVPPVPVNSVRRRGPEEAMARSRTLTSSIVSARS